MVCLEVFVCLFLYLFGLALNYCGLVIQQSEGGWRRVMSYGGWVGCCSVIGSFRNLANFF